MVLRHLPGERVKVEIDALGARISFNLDELADPEAKGIDPFNTNADTHFIVKADGKLSCFRDLCPHYGTTALAWRKDHYLTEMGQIHCGAHGALFESFSGECISGPCLGDRLESFAVSIDGDLASVLVPSLS